MTRTVEERISDYAAFFHYIYSCFGEMNKVLEPLAARAVEMAETYGSLDDEDGADAETNTQLSQLRILNRDYYSFVKNFRVSITALRDELDSKIEFGQTMLEGMGVGS
jgi:hypothetical protein